jgi:hypothetical protein
VLLSAVCAAVGAGAVLAVQASASGGTATTSPRPPSPPSPTSHQSIRATTASGQLSPAVTATNAHCGQTLTASLTLNGDLFCSGTALTVTGASAVLNLGGHEVAGPNGTASGPIGIRLSGKSETVTNGLVTNFAIGVYVTGASDTVSAVRATYNFEGIYDAGPTTKITNSVAASNGNVGIYTVLGAGGGTYSGDHELNNSYGLVIVSNAAKMIITGNIAEGNTIYGIDDGGFGTTLTKNIANFNGNDGIYVAEVAVIDGGGNTAKGNDYTTGNAPEQCHGVVCL